MTLQERGLINAVLHPLFIVSLSDGFACGQATFPEQTLDRDYTIYLHFQMQSMVHFSDAFWAVFQRARGRGNEGRDDPVAEPATYRRDILLSYVVAANV